MKELSRVDILGIIPGGIAKSYAILLDDTHRPQERAAVPKIVEALKRSGLNASSACYKARNSCDIIVSDDNQYLKTM